jgi:phosphate transport system ATP-binding protein
MSSPASKTSVDPTMIDTKTMIPTSTDAAAKPQTAAPKMRAANINFYYGSFKALHDVSLEFATNRVTALIGPSGCGKSTFLRNLNRINETLRDTRIEGEITLDGENILDKDVTEIRRRVGMVFQRPNPFPKSIFDNIIYGPKINGMLRHGNAAEIVEKSLRRAALWE